MKILYNEKQIIKQDLEVKKMGLEIEKKYLVHQHLLPKLGIGERMVQGYLSQTPSVRFRIIGRSMVITIKDYYSRSRRFELETPAKEITDDEIQKLRTLAISPPIVKVRHKIIDGQGLIWEIDVYEGENQGLVTVDVELPEEDHPILFPEWVANENEITGDLRYTNLNLGRKPFMKWTE